MNLLNETLANLEGNCLSLSDVVWIGTDEVEIPIPVFLELANKEYENGVGAQYVALDLVVHGDGWWLERHEYDGSEWWEFKKQRVRPTRTVIPRAVVDGSTPWPTLKELNHPEGKYSDVPFDWEGMEVMQTNNLGAME